jgi:hypothetical protein
MATEFEQFGIPLDTNASFSAQDEFSQFGVPMSEPFEEPKRH